LDTLIKAIPNIYEDAKCVFVGRGDTEHYRDLAKNFGVEDRCYFIDMVPTDELPLWYSWCDCMCTPSRWEGFGYVFIEAAACEAAIVTSNIAPMNEYLENEKNALLVDEFENPVAIANAVNRVLSNSEDIRKMKHEARNVGLNFAKEKVDEQEIEIYKEVIKMGSTNINKASIFHKINIMRKYL
jgi:glycosyltransferase involved in cell wall biosynthesis